VGLYYVVATSEENPAAEAVAKVTVVTEYDNSWLAEAKVARRDRRRGQRHGWRKQAITLTIRRKIVKRGAASGHSARQVGFTSIWPSGIRDGFHERRVRFRASSTILRSGSDSRSGYRRPLNSAIASSYFPCRKQRRRKETFTHAHRDEPLTWNRPYRHCRPGVYGLTPARRFPSIWPVPFAVASTWTRSLFLRAWVNSFANRNRLSL